MSAALEKEFAVPRIKRRWSFKRFEDGVINRPSEWVEDHQQPRIPRVEYNSAPMAVSSENFKRIPEESVFSSTNASQSVSLWTIPFMRLRVVSCLIGILPLTWSEPRKPSLHPLRSTMIYSIAVYTTVSVSLGFAASDFVGALSGELLTLNQHVVDLEMLLQLGAHLFTPIVWLDSQTEAEGFEVWASFIQNYYRVTGRKIACRRFGVELIFIFITLTMPSVIILTAYLTTTGINLELIHLPAFVYGTTVQCAIVFMWIGTSMSLSDVADDITSTFKESIETHGATPQVLLEYRRLWVMLRSVCDVMGEMISPLVTVTHTLVMATILLFEGLVFFGRSDTINGAAHVTGSVMLIVQIFFFCRASHNTALHMKLPIEVLDTLPVDTLSATAEREVNMFYLVENTKPAVITLSGFVVVNKSFFSSMLAAVSTYLIVLMQFHESSGRVSSGNTTASFF